MSPVVEGPTIDFFSNNPAQTRRIGVRFGELAQPGDVLCLEGPLGSGKTLLTQGIGQGLGVRLPIVSPSFTLIKEYRSGRIPLYHIDLYRLTSEQEAWELGLLEYLEGDGISVIEWADRAPHLMSVDCLWITLCHLSETKRSVVIQAKGARYVALLAIFRRLAFGGE
jgi:tRNA threonylcarbamoyladenosine biosynthesis protein TsaE